MYINLIHATALKAGDKYKGRVDRLVGPQLKIRMTGNSGFCVILMMRG